MEHVSFSRSISRATKLLGCALAFIFVLQIAGCGEGNRPPVVEVKEQTVTGKVVLGGGQPLLKGRVVLSPVKESQPTLYGKLGPGGAYTLSSAEIGVAGAGLGVTHGDFRVSVETENYLPGVKPKGLNFPPKYLDPATSELKYTISADTKTLPLIELK